MWNAQKTLQFFACLAIYNFQNTLSSFEWKKLTLFQGPKHLSHHPCFPCVVSRDRSGMGGRGAVVSGSGPTAFMVRGYLLYLLLNYVGLLHGGPCNVDNWPIVLPHKKKGPNKKWSGRFCTQRGRTCILTSLFPLILGKFKKFYTVATDIDKDNFCA